MLIAVRAEVESVVHWREKFKTHADLFKSQESLMTQQPQKQCLRIK